jgi:hypothetical protein
MVYSQRLVMASDAIAEHRQPVQVAVEPFVLAQDIAGGLDEAAEALGGGVELRGL